jgi:plasmid maintenance system antidote protein VapI
MSNMRLKSLFGTNPSINLQVQVNLKSQSDNKEEKLRTEGIRTLYLKWIYINKSVLQ